MVAQRREHQIEVRPHQNVTLSSASHWGQAVQVPLSRCPCVQGCAVPAALASGQPSWRGAADALGHAQSRTCSPGVSMDSHGPVCGGPAGGPGAAPHSTHRPVLWKANLCGSSCPRADLLQPLTRGLWRLAVAGCGRLGFAVSGGHVGSPVPGVPGI